MDVLCKEMNDVMIAFKPQPEEGTHVLGYRKISWFIIWDVKMDFTRKARCVAGGHRTEPTKALTYSSVVSRESVQLALLIAGLYLVFQFDGIETSEHGKIINVWI
jgi:hypothetical protein